MTLEELERKTRPVFDKYRIKYAGVFGSFARGEERADSDVDIMIDYNRPFSLLDLIGLENDLKDLLQKKVDVVTENGASKYMKSKMLRDLKVFYGQR
ncbi:nucleotidyltransferase family protein [Candidatus Nomurabacteria bacterium]|nr:nucleotidyltransferase family protein [Candidatus Nomurabacteria bacterium]